VEEAGLDWAEWGGEDVFGGYFYTEITGSPSIDNLNFTIAFEMDENGELVVDGDGNLTPVPTAGLDFAPNGYYRSNIFYSFQFQ